MLGKRLHLCCWSLNDHDGSNCVRKGQMECRPYPVQNIFLFVCLLGSNGRRQKKMRDRKKGDDDDDYLRNKSHPFRLWVLFCEKCVWESSKIDVVIKFVCGGFSARNITARKARAGGIIIIMHVVLASLSVCLVSWMLRSQVQTQDI